MFRDALAVWLLTGLTAAAWEFRPPRLAAIPAIGLAILCGVAARMWFEFVPTGLDPTAACRKLCEVIVSPPEIRGWLFALTAAGVTGRGFWRSIVRADGPPGAESARFVATLAATVAVTAAVGLTGSSTYAMWAGLVPAAILGFGSACVIFERRPEVTHELAFAAVFSMSVAGLAVRFSSLPLPIAVVLVVGLAVAAFGRVPVVIRIVGAAATVACAGWLAWTSPVQFSPAVFFPPAADAATADPPPIAVPTTPDETPEDAAPPLALPTL
ncbi:MAG: hypothetical protein AAF532_10285 [Planctomycetota bacterium]